MEPLGLISGNLISVAAILGLGNKNTLQLITSSGYDLLIQCPDLAEYCNLCSSQSLVFTDVHVKQGYYRKARVINSK